MSLGDLGGFFSGDPTAMRHRQGVDDTTEYLLRGGEARRQGSVAHMLAQNAAQSAAVGGGVSPALAARQGALAGSQAASQAAIQQGQQAQQARIMGAQMAQERINRERARMGNAAGALMGVAGTALGGMVGGPMGAQAGGALGGGVGRAMGSQTDTSRSPVMAGGGDPLRQGAPFGGVLSELDRMFGTGGMRSDEDSKEAIRDASAAIDQYLRTINPQSYNYRDPSQTGTRSGRQTGVMAQDLERSQVGRQMVRRGPDGQRMVDPQAALSTLLAAQGRLNDRLEALEGNPRRAGMGVVQQDEADRQQTARRLAARGESDPRYPLMPSGAEMRARQPVERQRTEIDRISQRGMENAVAERTERRQLSAPLARQQMPLQSPPRSGVDTLRQAGQQTMGLARQAAQAAPAVLMDPLLRARRAIRPDAPGAVYRGRRY